MAKHFKLYEHALGLYPSNYREAYAEQMLQTLHDMLADQPSRSARTRIWLRAWSDVLSTVVQQNLAASQQAALQTNREVRVATTVGGSLMLPFIIILLANAIARLAFNHDLYRSWLWATPVLTTWIVIFPGLALIIAITETVRALRKKMKLVRLWPLAVIGLTGLGVLGLVVFHDSTHCLVHNPVFVARNVHQTLQCVRHGMLGG